MRRIVQRYDGTMTTENQNVLSAAKIVLPPPKLLKDNTAQFPPYGLSTARRRAALAPALPKCSIIHKVLSALLA